MEIKIKLEKPNWSKQTWYKVGGCVLAFIILFSFLISYNSQTSQAKRQAEQYAMRMIPSSILEAKGTKFTIDSIEKRAYEETADAVIYDVYSTFIHRNKDTNEKITEYLYFYTELNKTQKKWSFGRIQPDHSRK